MKRIKILVYTSSAASVPVREGGERSSGTWLTEVTHTMRPFYQAGAEFVFATPDGRPCVIDEESKKLIYFGFSRSKREKELEFLEKLNSIGFKNPLNIADVVADDDLLNSFDALFIPGGHAPMTDVLHKNWLEGEELNPETGKLLDFFHSTGRPTGAICHGPAAFGAAPTPHGVWIYEGYHFTCISMAAEKLAEDAPVFGTKDHMIDYPKYILERLGGFVENARLGKSLVVEDREVMTGQDPLAGRELGRKFFRKVEVYIREHTRAQASTTRTYGEKGGPQPDEGVRPAQL